MPRDEFEVQLDKLLKYARAWELAIDKLILNQQIRRAKLIADITIIQVN
ncbi:MAG TPA: hypothetical protein VK671_14890 [Mucilaginibacter sp.]|jgi:hypothetical protein|nr:hypothetical protein [Mucilaginibacter sp.]